jgi:hypothetical protein
MGKDDMKERDQQIFDKVKRRDRAHSTIRKQKLSKRAQIDYNYKKYTVL